MVLFYQAPLTKHPRSYPRGFLTCMFMLVDGGDAGPTGADPVRDHRVIKALRILLREKDPDDVARRRLGIIFDVPDDADAIDILLATKRLLEAKKGTYLPYPGQLGDYAAALHADPVYAEYRYAQTIPSGFSRYELERQ